MMKNRWGTTAAVLVLGVASTGLAATAAHASNSSRNGCIEVFVEYESISATVKKVFWVESRDLCHNWGGHFETARFNGPDTNPVGPTHRIDYGGKIFGSGLCYSGTAWRNNGNGTWTDIGSTCTRLV